MTAGLEKIVERMREIEGDAPDRGWGELAVRWDERLGLRRGAIHEWFAPGGGEPAMAVLTHLAWEAIDQGEGRSAAVWIGRHCRPHPHALVRRPGRAGEDRRLLRRSLFVEPADAAGRLWAADLALRSDAVAVAIVDGRGLDMAATRRLQLAARAGGVVGLIARAPHERTALSAAVTRWLVEPQVSDRQPRWTLRLLRCKGGQPAIGPRAWAVEWNGATSAVVAVTDVADRADPSPALPATADRRTA